MSVCGIISEFNPFHNGHRDLIAAARENGATKIICVMSGNFTQRGDIAITDKRVRAHSALLCGADIVVELPVSYAMSTAQKFASGGIHLLKSMGVVDMLAFGSEAGDAELLAKVGSMLDSPEVAAKMQEFLSQGNTFAKARQLAVLEIYGQDYSEILSTPNNTLAIEYLREAKKQDVKLNTFTLKRLGVAHDSSDTSEMYASATQLRSFGDNISQLAQFVPQEALGVYEAAADAGLYPADLRLLETAILSQLRRLSVADISRLPDISEGLENRIHSAIRAATTLDELSAGIKTKRYTMSRVRRLILSAYIGITSDFQEIPPPYIRILGFNERGREMLSCIKEKATLPVSTSLADLEKTGGVCEAFTKLEALSTDLYSLALKTPLQCGYEYTKKPIFL